MDKTRLNAEWLAGFAQACIMLRKCPKGYAKKDIGDAFSRACITAQQIKEGGAFNPFHVFGMNEIVEKLQCDE